LGYACVHVHERLPQRIVSHVRSAPSNQVERDLAQFDITITDERGRVLIEVEQFTVRKIAQAAAFGGQSDQPSASASRGQLSTGERLFLESFEAGIEAAEGAEI